MNDIQLSKALGLASIAIGAAELFAGRRLTRALGLPIPHEVVRFVFGPREIINGMVALAHPDQPEPVAGLIVGDALDLAILGNALLPRNRQRHLAALAMAAVIGITIMDMAASTALSRRNAKALATARRTRVKQILA